ncbi:MAG: phospholipase D-like domain-containing protein, partial [Methanomassiliicoccaceae archaeon]|nr:phospholipase D-like domain-containing protein [Methanomassiliicoccaceae archaeon]
LLDHRDIISLLMLLLDNGVEVKILIEGSPAGGVPDIEIRYLTQLYEKGAEINIMKSNGGYKRYDLLHNKYAVIDSRTVVTTSENWREVSFTGNRGWGSVIESEDYAEYMRNIFFEDDDISKYDIFSLKQLYPSAAPISVPQYRSKITEEYETFSASVKPVLSPDFSFDYLEREMTNASERIYAEQMSVQYAWTDISLRSPLSWSLTAAGNGADVRIIADVTFDNEDDAYKDNYTVVSLINDMEGMQARTISGGDDFGLTHNKGVIIDDTVWVSSINWSNAAFLNNREVATEICSREVADYFVYYFMLDWGNDTEMDITVRITGNTSGKPVIMDASFGSFPKGTIFEWDLDGDGKIDRTGVKIAAVFPEGVHDCVLFATDVNGSRYVYEFTVTIENNDGSSFLGPYVKYAPIVAIMLIMLFVALFRRKRGSKG